MIPPAPLDHAHMAEHHDPQRPPEEGAVEVVKCVITIVFDQLELLGQRRVDLAAEVGAALEKPAPQLEPER